MEEPLALARLERGVVLVLKKLLEVLAHIRPGSRVGGGDDVGGHERLELDIKRVARGHDVVVVDALHEGLHLPDRGTTDSETEDACERSD